MLSMISANAPAQVRHFGKPNIPTQRDAFAEQQRLGKMAGLHPSARNNAFTLDMPGGAFRYTPVRRACNPNIVNYIDAGGIIVNY